jgi:hypothetical protein
MKRFSLVCLLVFSTSIAFAQGTVYRCGPDGKTYSQTPCPGGKQIDASDTRTEAQRADSLATTAADKKRADAMERERKAREAAQKPATASGFNSRPAAASDTASAEEKGKRQKKRTKKVAGDKPKKPGAKAAAKASTKARKAKK